MKQLLLPTPDVIEADRARLYAAAGNVDMANIMLHRWAKEGGTAGLHEFIAELRGLAVGNCLTPEAIGDPELFGGTR